MITLLHTPPIKINNPGAAVNGLHLTLSYTFDREVQGRSHVRLDGLHLTLLTALEKSKRKVRTFYTAVCSVA